MLLSWAFHRGTAAIPKSTTPSHIREYLAAITLTLSDEEPETIATLDQSWHYVPGKVWAMNASPYTLAILWGK